MAAQLDTHFSRPDADTLQLLGIAVPAALGGGGGDWTAFVDAYRIEVGKRGDLGYLMLLASQSWALKALLDHGCAEQVAASVPRILHGALVATALAEPQSGTDIAGTQTALQAQSNGWRLDGAKRHISYAEEAALVICLARGQADGTFRLVLLERQRHLYTAKPSPPKIGLANLPTGDLQLADIAIVASDFLAADKPALAILADFMTWGRGLIAVGAAEVMQHHLHATLQFGQARQTAGQAIAAQQYMQRKLTDVQMHITQTRLLGEEALRAHLAGDPQAVALGNMAKIKATEALLATSQTLLSILGTEGFQQSPISQFAIDALAFQAIGGTEEAHRLSLFKQMQRGVFG